MWLSHRYNRCRHSQIFISAGHWQSVRRKIWCFPFDQIFQFEIPGIPCDEWQPSSEGFSWLFPPRPQAREKTAWERGWTNSQISTNGVFRFREFDASTVSWTLITNGCRWSGNATKKSHHISDWNTSEKGKLRKEPTNKQKWQIK